MSGQKAAANQRVSQKTVNLVQNKELMPTIHEEERSPMAKFQTQEHGKIKSKFSTLQDSDVPQVGYNESPGKQVQSGSYRRMKSENVKDESVLPQIKLLRASTNNSLYSEMNYDPKPIENLPITSSRVVGKSFDPSTLNILNQQLRSIEGRMQDIKMTRKKREEEVIAHQKLLKTTNQKLLEYSLAPKKQQNDINASVLNSEDTSILKREIARLMADNQYLKETVEAKDNKINHISSQLSQMTLARSVALERNEVLMNEIQKLRKENTYLKRDDISQPLSVSKGEYGRQPEKQFVFNSIGPGDSRLDSGRRDDLNMPQSQRKAWRDNSPDISKLVRSNRLIKRSASKMISPNKQSPIKTPEHTVRPLPQVDPKALQRSKQLGGPELEGYTLWLANTKDMEFLNPAQKAKRDRKSVG